VSIADRAKDRASILSDSCVVARVLGLGCEWKICAVVRNVVIGTWKEVTDTAMGTTNDPNASSDSMPLIWCAEVVHAGLVHCHLSVLLLHSLSKAVSDRPVLTMEELYLLVGKNLTELAEAICEKSHVDNVT
jgi:hypothetical protein